MQACRVLLKQATEAAHRELDRRVSALDFGDLNHYRLFLEASAAALLPLEKQLRDSGVETVFADWPQRQRSDDLLADLQALRGVVPPLKFSGEPLTTAQMFGTMYVLEGSRLGAHVLLQRVPARPEITRYLRACDVKLWRSFLTQLESAMLDEPSLVESALRTFRIFHQAFEKTTSGLSSPIGEYAAV